MPNEILMVHTILSLQIPESNDFVVMALVKSDQVQTELKRLEACAAEGNKM